MIAGDVVAVHIYDHVEDGDRAEEFIVYGRVVEVTDKEIVIDSWEYADFNKPYDTNEKRWGILRAAVISIKQLVET